LIVIIKIYQTHQERGSYHISYQISLTYISRSVSLTVDMKFCQLVVKTTYIAQTWAMYSR